MYVIASHSANGASVVVSLANQAPERLVPLIGVFLGTAAPSRTIFIAQNSRLPLTATFIAAKSCCIFLIPINREFILAELTYQGDRAALPVAAVFAAHLF